MERLRIPVIGIGAGPGTDGQVLVLHDMLGLHEGHAPRFVKRFAEAKHVMVEGMRAYAAEVRDGRFPAEEHTYSIEPGELERFREVIAPGKPWDAADFIG
jgi:3-methyl-2-oxobutanoate hydroxymethyltransferase